MTPPVKREERTLEQRVLRLEGLLGIAPEFAACDRPTEFWIVQSEDDGLAYWGPFFAREDAQDERMFEPLKGCAIIEIPGCQRAHPQEASR